MQVTSPLSIKQKTPAAHKGRFKINLEDDDDAIMESPPNDAALAMKRHLGKTTGGDPSAGISRAAAPAPKDPLPAVKKKEQRGRFFISGENDDEKEEDDRPEPTKKAQGSSQPSAPVKLDGPAGDSHHVEPAAGVAKAKDLAGQSRGGGADASVPPQVAQYLQAMQSSMQQQQETLAYLMGGLRIGGQKMAGGSILQSPRPHSLNESGQHHTQLIKAADEMSSQVRALCEENDKLKKRNLHLERELTKCQNKLLELQEAKEKEEEAKESSVDTAPPNTTPFKTLAEMKTLQERFLGHHRRQWFANHDTRLKVALAQVSEAQSLQNKGPMSPNKSKVKSLLSLGKGRSGEWLNRMIDAVLNHLVEHHRQHTQHLNQQLTFMTSMVFLDHSLSSFHSEFMESFSTSVKVNCMAGSLRVAAWNMHEAFLGYFHKQYGTGTVVEEYMASMMVTLKQKLQDNAGRTATILNIIENEETPYMKNWKAMHRILWNMISNYWGGDVLARFVAALAAIDSFIQAENNKRSALNITSMNYEASSEWLCRRRAEIIADTVLGVRSVEAREIFEERITDISVPVEEDEKEMYLDIMENDLGGIVDDVTLEQYNQRHGDGEFCWKVLKAEFLYQLCLEASTTRFTSQTPSWTSSGCATRITTATWTRRRPRRCLRSASQCWSSTSRSGERARTKGSSTT